MNFTVRWVRRWMHSFCFVQGLHEESPSPLSHDFPMRKARWLGEWRKSTGKPVFFHVISRVVDRRFAFGAEEKFTGCRVVSYCLMCNHFHLLLEVPPIAEGGVSDEVLLKRLSAIYSEAFVAGVAKELADARAVVYVQETGLAEALASIHKRFTYRMHDLGEFMKGLLQRFTQWFNRTHSRTGRLWEHDRGTGLHDRGTGL
jgi:putative transposase